MSMSINHFDYGHRERSPSICELKPTWRCAIFSTKDALLLVQKCIFGELQAITRRPHDRERAELVKPGNVFVYTESDSGIKRWTDGVNWSPSRILNNFLVYRELDKAFGPGEKKKATKRPKRYSPYSRDSPGRQQQHPISDSEDIIVAGAHRRLTKDEERMLVGSLNDSYQFKQDGLIKKTFSITYGEQVFHVVSYYSYYAFLELDLPRPQDHWEHEKILPEFLTEQNFRVPINADGHEITGTTRDRVNHESVSRSPPQMEQNPYPVNMVRYTNHSVTPFGGYNLNTPIHPTQLHPMSRPPGETYYHSAPTYQGMRSDTESTHQYSYSPQPPRYANQTNDYNGHSGSEYPDTIHSQGQVVTSPQRFNHYGYNSTTTAPQLPPSPMTQSSMRAGLHQASAMQNLAARAENTTTYLNVGVPPPFNSHPSATEYEGQYHVSESPTDHSSMMPGNSANQGAGNMGDNGAHGRYHQQNAWRRQ